MFSSGKRVLEASDEVALKSQQVARTCSAVDIKDRFLQKAKGGDLILTHGSLASKFYAPHPRPGNGVVFSPNGEYMLRFGYQAQIKVIRTWDSQLVVTLKGMIGSISFACFSQDGAFILGASDDCKLLIYDGLKASRGESCLIKEIDVGMESLLFCRMCPDNAKVLSCDDEGELELWNVATGDMIRRFEPGEASRVANFADGGNVVVSCSHENLGVVLLDTLTASIIASEDFDCIIEGRNKPNYAISNDGKRVLAYIKDNCFEDNLAIMDTKTHEVISLRASNGSLLHAEFGDNGDTFVVAGRDNCIHVYESDTGEILGSLEGHDSDVMFCRISKDGSYVVSGDNSGNTMLWCLKYNRLLLRLQCNNNPIMLCDISEDNKRAFSLDNEGNCMLWSLDMQGLFDVLSLRSDEMACCALCSREELMAVAYTDGSVKLWQLGLKASVIWEANEHNIPVVCMVINPLCTFLASASRDGLLVLSEIRTGETLATVTLPGHTINCIAFDDSGDTMLASSRDGILEMYELMDSDIHHWKLEPPKPSMVFEAPSCVTSCALSPDGGLVAATTEDGELTVWSSGGVVRFSCKVTDIATTYVSFAQSGQFLLVGSRDGSTSVFDTTGIRKRTLIANASPIVAAYFEGDEPHNEATLDAAKVVSLCGLQSVHWSLEGASQKLHTADFIADGRKMFNNRQLENRMFVPHSTLAFFDAKLCAVMYCMREFSQYPGDSYLFRQSTALVKGGVHSMPLVMFAPCHEPITMLMNETGGAKSLDFSSDGRLLVCGNFRGELSIWDVECSLHIRTWMAHKRSAITCVRFSHNGAFVLSCAEDGKVILWDSHAMTRIASLHGHATAVVSLDMSLDGQVMASSDNNGVVIIWDMLIRQPREVIQAHVGPTICCTISPNGSQVASSGVDEHISIRDCITGEEILSLDDALDGRGMTMKFSFDGTRIQIGGSNGSILVWSVSHNCLIYEIKAHEGNVYDCSWSGDSRQLLSVGADGKVRLWDAAAGSEICQANFEVGFGDIETGGFIRADLSSNGDTMAGCTAKGHLIQWDINHELMRVPSGNMLYKWLSSFPVTKAKEVYATLIDNYPLLVNAQDSQGWTVLMHAVNNSNPEICKIILGSVKPKSGVVGLISSRLRTSPGILRDRKDPGSTLGASKKSKHNRYGKTLQNGSSKSSRVLSPLPSLIKNGGEGAGGAVKTRTHSILAPGQSSRLEDSSRALGGDSSSTVGETSRPGTPESNSVPGLSGEQSINWRWNPIAGTGSSRRTASRLGPGPSLEPGGSSGPTSGPESIITPATIGGSWLSGHSGALPRAEPACGSQPNGSSRSASGSGAIPPAAASDPLPPAQCNPSSRPASAAIFPPPSSAVQSSPINSGAVPLSVGGPIGESTEIEIQPSLLALSSPIDKTTNTEIEPSLTELVARAGSDHQPPGSLTPPLVSHGSSGSANRVPNLSARPPATGVPPSKRALARRYQPVAENVEEVQVLGGGAPRALGAGAGAHGYRSNPDLVALERGKSSLSDRVLSVALDRGLSRTLSHTPEGGQSGRLHKQGSSSLRENPPASSANRMRPSVPSASTSRPSLVALMNKDAPSYSGRGTRSFNTRTSLSTASLSGALAVAVHDASEEQSGGDGGGDSGGGGGASSTQDHALSGAMAFFDDNPNALQLAIQVGSADCLSHLLDAIISEKVTIGSYIAVTVALPQVAQYYPDMVFHFMSDLTLTILGEVEIPTSLTKNGRIVQASTSYTSYKEMWTEALHLDQIPKGPTVMMQATMVKLPYAARIGKDSILETLIGNTQINVKTFGSETLKAIINYKWDRFAKKQIFTKALVYMVFISIFTVYAIIRTDMDPDDSLAECMQDSISATGIVLSVIIFFFGLYYLALEVIQMVKLGLRAYFDSGWNVMDIVGYSICLVLAPCEILRYGVAYSDFMWPLVAVQTVLLWMKVGFFAFAVDGLGNFIYMASEILKGMRYFMLLLVTLWLMFAVAFMNLFPKSYVYGDGTTNTLLPDVDNMWRYFHSFGIALMSAYMTTFNALDPHDALPTRHPEVAIILICVFNFIIILLLTNMLITLMADIYYRIRDYRDVVFMENRGQLVIEVETTMTGAELKQWEIPPFLHILTPIQDAGNSDVENDNEGQRNNRLVDTFMKRMEEHESKGFARAGAVVDPAAMMDDGDGDGDELDPGSSPGGAQSLSKAASVSGGFSHQSTLARGPTMSRTSLAPKSPTARSSSNWGVVYAAIRRPRSDAGLGIGAQGSGDNMAHIERLLTELSREVHTLRSDVLELKSAQDGLPSPRQVPVLSSPHQAIPAFTKRAVSLSGPSHLASTSSSLSPLGSVSEGAAAASAAAVPSSGSRPGSAQGGTQGDGVKRGGRQRVEEVAEEPRDSNENVDRQLNLTEALEGARISTRRVQLPLLPGEAAD